MRRFPLEILIAAAILVAGVAVRVLDPGPVARLRASVFDSYLNAMPRPADPDFPVRVVAVDEASLAEIGQWPWPRAVLARLVDRLADAGARSITFDILLAEPDRLSPEALSRGIAADALPGDLRAALARLPSNDALLAAALARAPTVLGLVGDHGGDGRRAPLPPPRASFAHAGDDPRGAVVAFPSGVASLGALTDAAPGLGAVNWLPADDLVIRRVPLLVAVGGRLYPSLAVEALRVGTGQSTILVRSSGGSGLPGFGQRTGPELVRVGDVVVPTDGRGEMWLWPAPSDPRRTLSARDVLSGAADAAAIRGRHVLIGATAAGLLDLRATPLAASVPGVEIHAQALEQMLAGAHVLRPAYATGAEIAFLLAVGGLVTWLLRRVGPLAALVAATAAVVLVVAASRLAVARAGLLLDPVYPALVLIALYIAASVTSFVRAEIERARIRSAFGHYVAPELVAELALHPERVRLGGESRTVTLMFADVRGFTALAEGRSPEELVRFVNRLFTPLSEIILAHRGTIDKFLGDAVMAFWNAPLSDRAHATNACRAALAMQAVVARLDAELAAEAAAVGGAHRPLRLGIGVNTGPCVVGNLGSPERFDYSAIGEAVNVAARLEEATKTSGAAIVVGASTAALARELALVEIATVVPRGMTRPETIFALVGDETVASSGEFRRLETAHRELRAAEARGDAAAADRARATCLSLAPPLVAGLYRAPPGYLPG